MRSDAIPSTTSYSQTNEVLTESANETRDSPDGSIDKGKEEEKVHVRAVVHNQLDSVEPHPPSVVEKAGESEDSLSPKSDVSCKNGVQDDKTVATDKVDATSSAKVDSDVDPVTQTKAKTESGGMELNTGSIDALVDVDDTKIAEVSSIAESTVCITVESALIEGKEERQQSQEASEKREGEERDEEKAPVPPPRRKRKKKMNKQPSLENLVDVSMTEKERKERLRERERERERLVPMVVVPYFKRNVGK